MARSANTRRIRVTGPIFQPAEPSKFEAYVLEKIKPLGAEIQALVESRTPVDTGKLKGSIEVRVAAERKGKSIGIKVSAKATRPETPGDKPRRSGDVPYGVFVDQRTGFISDTLQSQHLPILRTLTEAVREYVRMTNAAAGTGTGKGAA